MVYHVMHLDCRPHICPLESAALHAVLFKTLCPPCYSDSNQMNYHYPLIDGGELIVC